MSNTIAELFQRYSSYVESFEYVPGVTPLSSWKWPATTSFSFLLVIFLLNRWMKNRQAFRIEGIVAAHNFFLGALSLIMTIGIGFHILVTYLTSPSYLILFCDDEKGSFTNKGGAFFWIYIFYLSKYYELLDTVFLCLRKKPLNFLHVYHHWITMVLIWVCLHCGFPVQWVAEFLNAFVHVPMYFYYFLGYFNYQPWWKRYITQLQIGQFVLVLASDIYANYLYYFTSVSCKAFDNTIGHLFSAGIVWSYLFLFIHFYFTTYKKPAASKTKKDK